MTIWEADADAPADTKEGAAGGGPAAEKPFFASPFRKHVLYAWYMVQIVGLSIVIVTLLILQCNK